jgi:hypothetical protein
MICLILGKLSRTGGKEPIDLEIYRKQYSIIQKLLLCELERLRYALIKIRNSSEKYAVMAGLLL